jgi:hypothetical protein
MQGLRYQTHYQSTTIASKEAVIVSFDRREQTKRCCPVRVYNYVVPEKMERKAGVEYYRNRHKYPG